VAIHVDLLHQRPPVDPHVDQRDRERSCSHLVPDVLHLEFTTARTTTANEMKKFGTSVPVGDRATTSHPQRH